MPRVLAIVGLRFRLMHRRLRGATGWVGLAATVALAALALLLALALAIGFGAVVHVSLQAGGAEPIRTAFASAFYSFLFFGLIVPMLTGSLNPGFDAGPLRIFPISARKLYLLTIAAAAGNSEHLLYYPALLAIFVLGIVLPGANLAIGSAAFVLILLFYVVWANTLVLALVSMMRRRRMREVLAIVSVSLVVGASFAIPLLQEPRLAGGELDPSSVALLKAAAAVASALPPSLAAEAWTASHFPGEAAAWPSLIGLLVWNSLGIALGYQVFARLHLAEPGGAPARRRTRRSNRTSRLTFDHRALGFLPLEVRVIADKELRYLLRSVVGKFNLVIMPVFVVLMAFLVGRVLETGFLGLSAGQTMLFGLIYYSTLFSNNFVNNAFAWDGKAVQAFFLMPVPPRRVLAGKNLAVWAYGSVLLAILLVTWCFVQEVPGPATLLTALLIFVVCSLAFTTVGNVVSVLFPVGRDISTMRSTPSRLALLLSIATLLLAGLLIALCLYVPLALGIGSFAPLALLGIVVVLGSIYIGALRLTGDLLERRKERLIEALRVAE